MEMIHYYSVPSSGMLTHWMLEEAGAPYENRLLDVSKDEQKSASLLEINTMGRVPILLLNGRGKVQTPTKVSRP